MNKFKKKKRNRFRLGYEKNGIRDEHLTVNRMDDACVRHEIDVQNETNSK